MFSFTIISHAGEERRGEEKRLTLPDCLAGWMLALHFVASVLTVKICMHGLAWIVLLLSVCSSE
jgi:hypothetical protein